MDSVLFTITGAAIAVVVAVLQWLTSTQETWSKRAHHWFLLLAAILTAYGSWRAFLLSEEKTWQQEEVQFRNEWLQRQQLKERLKYESELRAKAAEIASLNREIVAITTGGDSYPFLAISVDDNKTNEPAMLVLFHRGKFPLYDVSVEITDTEKYQEIVKRLGLPQALTPVTLEQNRELNKAKVVFPPVNLRPDQGLTLRGQWLLASDKDVIEYNIQFFARNGSFYQQLKLKRINGFWRQAGRVFRHTGFGKPGVFLYESVDPQFPRDKRGKPIW